MWARPGEKDAKIAQKSGQLQPFVAAFPGMHGPTCICLADLTPFSLPAAPGAGGGLRAAAGLAAVALVLGARPGADFAHCVRGLRGYLWPLRVRPPRAVEAMAAVRMLCKVHPLLLPLHPLPRYKRPLARSAKGAVRT